LLVSRTDKILKLCLGLWVLAHVGLYLQVKRFSASGNLAVSLLKSSAIFPLQVCFASLHCVWLFGHSFSYSIGPLGARDVQPFGIIPTTRNTAFEHRNTLRLRPLLVPFVLVLHCFQRARAFERLEKSWTNPPSWRLEPHCSGDQTPATDQEFVFEDWLFGAKRRGRCKSPSSGEQVSFFRRALPLTGLGRLKARAFETVLFVRMLKCGRKRLH
jgi:hypothetical protein